MTTKRTLIGDKFGKRAVQLLHMLAHPRRHMDYVRAIRRAQANGLAPAGALMSVKYLGVYLAEFLTTEARRRAIIFHYDLVARALPPRGDRHVWRDGCTIWSRHSHNVNVRGGNIGGDDVGGDDVGDFAIVLEDARLSPMEGESQLRFTMGGLTLCTLSFSFLPGASVDLPCAETMFIGGVQGGAHCRDEIRLAAKANGEISPSAMLMVAARAIVEAMSVDHVVGVSSEFQAAMGYAAEKISLSYDKLWLESGAVQCPSGLFSIMPGSVAKPLDQISRSHRARTRRKRELKAALKIEMRRNVEQMFGLAGRYVEPVHVAPVALEAAA